MPERTLVELLYGKFAHANPVACVEDVSFELAAKRAGNFQHSIFQLVSHVNYWMDYELKRIRGEMPAYPAHAAESWLAYASPSDESEWKKAVAQFKDLLAKLAALAESTPEVLAREVPATHPITSSTRRHSTQCSGKRWFTTAITSVRSLCCAGRWAHGRQALAATPGSAACLPEYNESFGSGRRTGRRPFP
jgi:hypothetical protein